MRVELQELRIGNWITVMGSIPTQVTAYHLYMMETDVPVDPTEANYKEMINAIPLTEEWLLKFGFEKLSNFEEQYMEEDYVWQIDVERSPSLILSNGVFHEDNYGVKLEYVHQLQNLYYALTGEELTIKETV